MHKANPFHFHSPVVMLVALFAAPVYWLSLFSKQATALIDSARQPILEVVEISGPDWGADRYLYLRVFPDGSVEFQDPRKIDLTKEMPLLRERISDQDRQQLMLILNSQEARELSGVYERENIGNIRAISLIHVARDGGKQNLEFVNFDSESAMEGGRAYTSTAELFGKIIRIVRKHSLDKHASASEAKQLTTENVNRNVILEVLATDYQLYTQKRFVFARVSYDGWVEYHDPFHVDLLYPMIIRKRLPADEFAQLKEIFAEPAIRQLRGEYHGWSGVDTSVRWDFLVPDADDTQKFVLWNFTYPRRRRPDNVRPIPNAADELGCFLMRINEGNLHFRGMPERCMRLDQSK